MTQSLGRRIVHPKNSGCGMLMRPYVPPSCGNVVKTPMITEEIASVSRMRYSPESFWAGSATSVPARNAKSMPMIAVGRKLHPWVITR